MDRWKTRQIKDFESIDVILGQSPSSSSYNTSNDGLPFLQGKAEFGMIYPTPEKYTSAPIKIAKENDILMSVRAPVGDVNIAPYKLCIGRGLAALRIKDDSPRFYYYWFQKHQNLIENMGTGSTFKAITGEQIKKIELPIVEQTEQKAIAEILSTVDEAIQKSDEAIRKTERIKQGVMHKLLTEGIGHKEYQETKIGRIPKEWDVKKLIDLTVNITDGKHGDCKNEKNSGYYFISAKDVIDGKIVYENARQITKVDFEETHKRTKLNVNDIILTNSGSIAKTAYIDDSIPYHKTTFQKSVAIIKPIEEFVLPKYLYHCLTGNHKRLDLLANGTSQKNLLLKDLRDFRIPIPKLDEQKLIVNIIDSTIQKFQLNMRRKQSLERIKQGLMDDLLTGKKRVQITANN